MKNFPLSRPSVTKKVEFMVENVWYKLNVNRLYCNYKWLE